MIRKVVSNVNSSSDMIFKVLSQSSYFGFNSNNSNIDGAKQFSNINTQHELVSSCPYYST